MTSNLYLNLPEEIIYKIYKIAIELYKQDAIINIKKNANLIANNRNNKLLKKYNTTIDEILLWNSRDIIEYYSNTNYKNIQVRELPNRYYQSLTADMFDIDDY